MKDGKYPATAREFDLVMGDYGPMLEGHFEYTGDGYGAQGMGRIVAMPFVERFLKVFKVDRLSKVNGRPCWVTTRNQIIARIDPFHDGEGTAFDIDEFNEERRRNCVPQ